MNRNTKSKGQKSLAQSALESLKDLGSSTADQMRQEAKQLPRNLMEQIIGPRNTFSGEIAPGEAIELDEVLTNKHKEITYEKKRVAFEKRLLEEERKRVEETTNELKIRLQVLQQEIITLADKTEGLAQETQVAAMQITVEPGVYHIIFFEKLFEFIKSFRKKIEEARVWLQTTNKRASKKNRWGANYQKHGAKYLLSGEHYLSRSAG